MEYGRIHRYFLRTIASLGVLSITDVKKILADFAGENMEINIQNIVKEVNDEIRQYQQEIRITSDEVTSEDVVVFMSIGFDETTKSQNVFSPNELEFFRELIEQIMTTESRQITGMNAINLVGKVKSSFTKTDAQKLLNTWCKMRYLDKEGNNYALGVRSIHEFEGYLRENMPDTIANCICKKIVYRGYNCPHCYAAVHTRCLMQYLKKVKKWPCCDSEFQEEQLERLNNQRSTQSQQQETTQSSTVYNTVVEPTLNQNSEEEMDTTQETTLEISGRVNRKRKRTYD